MQTQEIRQQNSETSASQEVSKPAKYMPGLDVVRGAAILGVLLYHALRTDAVAMHDRLTGFQFAVFSSFQVGMKGVHLFFVLSGFLITGILLDTKQNKGYFKAFYIRRVLRIVPAYILMIVALKSSGAISWRFVAVCALYLVNMSALLGTTAEYASFWSLSVEEQFYLIWPAVVHKLKLRRLVILSLAIVALTPMLRFALCYAPSAFHDIYYKTWAVGDFFAAGALLAILVRSARFRQNFATLALSLIACGATLIVFAAMLPVPSWRAAAYLQKALFLSPWMLLCTGIILAAYQFPTIAAWPGAKSLVFLGYISYGLYMVHSAIFGVMRKVWPLESSHAAGWPLAGLILLRFLLESSISIALAWLSRSTIEEYFLRRKPRQPKVLQNVSLAN